MKKIAVSFVLILLCVFSLCAIDYSIDSYNVQVVIGRNAVHAVNEDIAMNFKTAGHGFYRDIPYEFDGSPVHARITDIACSDKYEREYTGGYCSLKIGDGNKTVTGVKNYSLSYNYDLGIDMNQGYDEFYFDLLGSSWECSTKSFDFQVYLPKDDIDLNELYVAVTYGSYGSDKILNYKMAEFQDYYVIYGSAENLRAGQAVTIKIQMQDGWFVGAREPWDMTQVFKVAAPYISIVLVIIAFIIWVAYGKDKTPIIQARFEAPEGFSPMIVGYLADNSVDDKDIISMIFNWADRGLLTVNEKRKNQFSFTKLKDIEESVPKAERDLFNAFFRGCKVGDTQTLSRLQANNFAQAMMNAKISVAKIFTKEKRLYSRKSRAFSVLVGFFVIIPLILLSAAFALNEYNVEIFAAGCIAAFIVTAFGILNQWLVFKKWYLRKSNIFPCVFSALPQLLMFVAFSAIFGDILIPFICCASSFALAVFTIIIGKRSEYGQKILEEILGYREFIDKVEMDELKMMIKKDPQLYYKVLSYAVVLGLENKWAKKFEGIAVPAPNWYVGTNVVDIMYYSHMASRMRTVVAANSIPQSTGKGVGGTGFHTSGFAGGGFGGGGGRAW